MKKAEEKVSSFYNGKGWDSLNGITEDAKQFEDLRECSKEYLKKCRMRVLDHIPKEGEFLLDMASGPIQYPEYLDYSKGFLKRYCVDLSKKALIDAEKKIGSHGVFINKSLFDIDFKENFFDAVISLHTIYHIDANQQKDAVLKLINSVKTGKPVVIVYSNPNTIRDKISKVINRLKYFSNKRKNITDELYFYRHNNSWWYQFENVGNVDLYPWRSLSGEDLRSIIPNNILGRNILNFIFYLESKFPKLFTSYFQYPMVVIRKK